MDELAGSRRFRAYGVGMAKSGTHSLATIFKQYRAAHEIDSEAILSVVLDAAAGALTSDEELAFLAQRDREQHLEMDASQLNYFFVDRLVALFPNARFILTVRDCYSWLDSLINHQLGRSTTPNWLRLRELRFGGGRRHSDKEQILAEKRLFTLDGYLSYWATHNQRVLDIVPPQRLLVVRVNDLKSSIPSLAEFLGIPAASLDASEAHAFPAEKRFGILRTLDHDFLHAKAEQHCGRLMQRYFPTIHSLDAALSLGS